MSDGESSDRRPDGERSGDSPRGTVGERLAADSSRFASLTGSFYRGEVDRMTTWRTRLDQTTNWAVVVMAAILTWAFSSRGNPHYVILVGALAVTAFLLIETRRYREYDAWRVRVLLLQQHLYADVYRPSPPDREGTPSERDEWRTRLSEDLRSPRLRVSFTRALSLRLQHVYFPLMTVLLAAWALRITVFEPGKPWTRTAAIAGISGPAVVAAVAGWFLAFAALTLRSYRRGARREFDDEVASERGD